MSNEYIHLHENNIKQMHREIATCEQQILNAQAQIEWSEREILKAQIAMENKQAKEAELVCH